MNKDQLQGAMKEFAGSVQQSVGKLIGSKAHQMRGFQRQVLGRAERHLGDAREMLKGTRDAVKAAVHV